MRTSDQACVDVRRDSKVSSLVDAQDSRSGSFIGDQAADNNTARPLAWSDLRRYSLSMSEYNNNSPTYEVYDYNGTTRPANDNQDYAAFGGASRTFSASQYAGTQAQVPSGLPQSTAALGLVPSAQPFGTHDQPLYSATAPHDGSYHAYLDLPTPSAAAQPLSSSSAQPAPPAQRQLPGISAWGPNQGPAGTPVSVYLRSIHDFDAPPVKVFLMFGQRRCETTLSKDFRQGQMYHYTVAAAAPPLSMANTASPAPVHLILDQDRVAWDSPSLELGTFTYFDTTAYYATESPTLAKKRKLSAGASPRLSPTKKHSAQALSTDQALYPNQYPLIPSTPYRRPSVSDVFQQSRRLGSAEYVPTQQYGISAPSSYAAPMQSPRWHQQPSVPTAMRSPHDQSRTTGGRTPLPTEPNPTLIRTSTLGVETTMPIDASSSYNPYNIYSANSKANLRLDGDLNSMADGWTPAEWDARRRLVQFRRSQSGSTITATFEAVTLEGRAQNSICVSCIWWEERQECYVTSVDTISLLESLVAVRFTVEEKNRIRRNLEGFRPATVSKIRADSEDFFKLIMGFPNPKPRNIEKDVKVFPWRILATALKKIIGKYSASYASSGAQYTASATPVGYYPARTSDASLEQQRAAASPRSTSSSATSHAPRAPYAYSTPLVSSTYAQQHAGAAMGMGGGPLTGPTDLRFAAGGTTAGHHHGASWHAPGAAYASEPSRTHHARRSWDMNYDTTGHSTQGAAYTEISPATGLPSSAHMYEYGGLQRLAPLTASTAGTESNEGRFIPLRVETETDPGQPTTTA